MTKDEFKKARDSLGLSQDKMAIQLGDDESRYSVRAVASWESGERKIPPAVAKLVKLMIMAQG